MSDGPNSEQAKYWSEEAGPRWVAVQEQTDAQLRAFGVRAIESAAISPGERVLDVGAGCGDTSLELARRVGPTGHVHAVDVSAVMLDRARERALREGLAHVTFQVADVQASGMEHAPFDAAISRFGVMFFQDPVIAFGRIRSALVPGGRLAFCSWRGPEENAWLAGIARIASQFVDVPPTLDPHAPGPFGLFDAERTRGLLSAAGWADIQLEPFDMPMVLGGARTVDEAVDFLVRLGPVGGVLAGLVPAEQRRFLAEIRAHLAPHERPEGVVMKGASWIVTARNDQGR